VFTNIYKKVTIKFITKGETMIDKNNIKKLNGLQEEYNLFMKEFKENKEIFDKENEMLINLIKDTSESINDIKEILRIEGVNEYKTTNSKKLTGGLSIRITKDVRYDNDLAFSWAMNHKMCLSLDKTKFKKIAKVQELDFVDLIEKETVCFPKVLK